MTLKRNQRMQSLPLRLARAIGHARGDRSAWCREHHVDPGQLSRILAGLAMPGRAVAVKIERITGIPVSAWARGRA